MKLYTDETWPGLLEADGEDVMVTVAAGASVLEYCLFGERDGSIIVCGDGDGSAYRTGSGWGFARRLGLGGGYERDASGTRKRISSPPGIKYSCAYGDGHLRIGCEVNTLADWIEHAEEIDGAHSNNIAARTRALALELQQKETKQ